MGIFLPTKERVRIFFLIGEWSGDFILTWGGNWNCFPTEGGSGDVFLLWEDVGICPFWGEGVEILFS